MDYINFCLLVDKTNDKLHLLLQGITDTSKREFYIRMAINHIVNNNPNNYDTPIFEVWKLLIKRTAINPYMIL